MKIGITSDCSSGLEYAPFKHNIIPVVPDKMDKYVNITV